MPLDHLLPVSSHRFHEGSSCCQLRKARLGLAFPSPFFSGRSFVCTSAPGKVTFTCFRSSTVLAVSFENMPGRVDTLVDAGVKVSDVEFVSDVLDLRYRENNRAAPPVVPSYPPLDEDGPNELDFEIYASNCMADYEPPPTPRTPFTFPFEDYYGEAVGVDYISKEEMPANSLLQFLDSLKTKRAKEDAGNGESHLFSNSNLQAAEIKKENPEGFEAAGLKNAAQTSVVQDKQGVVADGPEPVGLKNAAEISVGKVKQVMVDMFNLPKHEEEETSSKAAPKIISENPSISSGPAMSETFSPDGGYFQPRGSPAPLTFTATSHEAPDADRPLSVHAIGQTQHLESRSSEELKKGFSSFFPSDRAVGEASVWSAQSGTHRESDGTVPLPSQTGSRDDLSLADMRSQEHIKGNSMQREYTITVDESILPEYAEVRESTAGPKVEVALSVTGNKDFASAQGLDSLKDAVPGSSYYVPQKGDIVVGAVTFMSDQKVDLEIGAKSPALMSLRDVQPLLLYSSIRLFDHFREADLRVASGESLLFKGDTALNSCGQTGMLDVGTVLVAEVTGKTIIDGRAILSCKLPAQRLAWHRMNQLRRFGEAILIEITQWNEGGLLGSWEGIRVFIPTSELVQRPNKISLLKNYVGQTLSVAVMRADFQTFSIVASETGAWMSKYLQLGTVHDVTVTRVHSYGIQVEINNTKIRGFVHKSNFSKEFVSCANDYFTEGDKARAMLIKGRDPTKVSFSLADLENENGLLLRDKEQVFRDAKEMGRRFREHLSGQERRIYGMADIVTSLDYRDPDIANLAWLQI